MGRGKNISPYVKAKIREKKREGATNCELMALFQVSLRTVQRACNHSQSKRKLKGRPCALTSSDRRRLVTQARQNPTKTSAEHAHLLGIPISSCTIHQELRKQNFSSVRVQKTIRLSPAAIEKCLTFARENFPKGADFWKCVMFTDEKKWNLRGNDGYVRIWTEDTNTLTMDVDLNTRPGVIVWGGICENGAWYIQRIHAKIKSSSYQQLLATEIFDSDPENLPQNFVFQQDNAPFHVSRSSKNFFKTRKIPLLSWPPYSPDLNIIENLWAIISQKVYAGGKEYKTSNELWGSVSHHFMTISDDVVGRLYCSIPNRLMSVLENHGKRTHY